MFVFRRGHNGALQRDSFVTMEAFYYGSFTKAQVLCDEEVRRNHYYCAKVKLEAFRVTLRHPDTAGKGLWCSVLASGIFFVGQYEVARILLRIGVPIKANRYPIKDRSAY